MYPCGNGAGKPSQINICKGLRSWCARRDSNAAFSFRSGRSCWAGFMSMWYMAARQRAVLPSSLSGLARLLKTNAYRPDRSSRSTWRCGVSTVRRLSCRDMHAVSTDYAGFCERLPPTCPKLAGRGRQASHLPPSACAGCAIPNAAACCCHQTSGSGSAGKSCT